MTSIRRAWGVVMILAAMQAWAADKPIAESPIDACVKARALSSSEHFIRVLDHDGEELSRWSGVEAPPAAQCERMMRDALKGKPARAEEHATIRAQKEVSFKVVKCTMSGLASAGFGRTLHFETWH